MHPLIQQAQRIHAFDLTPEIGAVLLGDITTGGIIQYHYVLVVINKSSGSFLYVASEWSSQYSERKNTPALGVFEADSHETY